MAAMDFLRVCCLGNDARLTVLYRVTLSESPLYSRLSWCLESFAPVSVLAYHILLSGFRHAPGSLCEHGYGKKPIADLGNRALGSGSDRVGLHGACKPHKILRPCQRRIPEMAYCHRVCTPVHSLSPNDFWILLDLAPAACQLIRILVGHRLFPSSSCMLPCRSLHQASQKSVLHQPHEAKPQEQNAHDDCCGWCDIVTTRLGASKANTGGLKKRHSFAFSCILHV
jgi:hypothetical protein